MKICILCKTWYLSTGHKGASLLLVLLSEIIPYLAHCVLNILDCPLTVCVLDLILGAHDRK